MQTQPTRRAISKIAKLITNMSHAEALEAIAKCLGHSSAASLMADLKANEGDRTPAPKAQKIRVVYAFGYQHVRAVEESIKVTNKDGGLFMEHEFATKGEVMAYYQGINDAHDWENLNGVIDEVSDPGHPYFHCKPGSFAGYEDWHNANHPSEDEDDESEGSEYENGQKEDDGIESDSDREFEIAIADNRLAQEIISLKGDPTGPDGDAYFIDTYADILISVSEVAADISSWLRVAGYDVIPHNLKRPADGISKAAQEAADRGDRIIELLRDRTGGGVTKLLITLRVYQERLGLDYNRALRIAFDHAEAEINND